VNEVILSCHEAIQKQTKLSLAATHAGIDQMIIQIGTATVLSIGTVALLFSESGSDLVLAILALFL
jgi:hypothetical protein